jgi:hypothetical protein
LPHIRWYRFRVVRDGDIDHITLTRSGARPQPGLFTFILNRNKGRVTLERVC